MGRNSIKKTRKELNNNMLLWLDTLVQKLKYHDINRITLDEIAEVTNKSKSTIYEYFSTKEEIIEAAVERRLKAFETFPDWDSKIPILEQYQSFIEWLCSHLHDISFAFLNSLKKSFPEIWKKIQKLATMIFSRLQMLYSEGIKQKIFSEIEVELLLKLDEFYILNYLPNQANSNSEIKESIYQYVSLRLNGLMKI